MAHDDKSTSLGNKSESKARQNKDERANRSQPSKHQKTAVSSSMKKQADLVSPRERIVQTVLLDVLEGRLPAGQRLVTEQLAQRFDVSHTPIREALLTLSGMGVVHLLPNRGAVVKNFSPQEIREIWDVRLALEVAAVRSACGRIPDEELQRLDKQLNKLASTKNKLTGKDVRLATQLDTAVHTLIRTHAKNHFLAHELTRIHSLIVIVRDAAWKHLVQADNLTRVVEESAQHLEIVRALQARDAPRACRAMRDHLRSGKRTIVKAVQSPRVLP